MVTVNQTFTCDNDELCVCFVVCFVLFVFDMTFAADWTLNIKDLTFFSFFVRLEKALCD